MQSAHSTTSTNPVPLPCQALTTQAPSTDLLDTIELTDFGNTDTICLSPSDFGLYGQEPEVVNLFTDLNFSNALTIFTSAVSTVTSAVQTVAATSTVQTAGPCSLDGYDASLPPPPPELWMESFPDHISYLAIPMPPRLMSLVPLPQPEVSVSLPQPEVSAPPPQLKTSFASPQPEVSVSLPQPEVSVPPPQPKTSFVSPQLELPFPVPNQVSTAPLPQPEVFVYPPQLEISARPPHPETSVPVSLMKSFGPQMKPQTSCPSSPEYPLTPPPDFLDRLVPPLSQIADTTRLQCSKPSENTDAPTPMELHEGPAPEPVVVTSGVSQSSHSSSSTTSTTRTMSADATELVSTESPHSPSSDSPVYSSSIPLYSHSIPQYSPGSPESVIEYVPTKKRRLHSDKTKPKFPPPPPVDIPIYKSRNKYDYLLHDPRTLFAGAPSSFLHGEDSKYASKMRKRALQIGTKPEDISFCIDGHVLSTMETVKTESFFYQMSTTFSPLPKKKRFESTASQTDVQTLYCEGCQTILKKDSS